MEKTSFDKGKQLEKAKNVTRILVTLSILVGLLHRQRWGFETEFLLRMRYGLCSLIS